MAAGKHGSAEITISYDDPAGAPQVITGFVLTMGPVKITSKMQVGTAIGDAVEKSLPTGMRKLEDLTLHGFYDDTPTSGSHAVLGAPDTSPQALTRTLAIGFGGKTWTSEGYEESYAVIGKVDNLVEFEAVLKQNSGAWS